MAPTGTLEAISTESEGTTFTLTLPRHTPKKDTDADDSSDAQA